MLDERDIELLEAYTYGEVSGEEERSLRERILANPEFASAVRQWELVEREGFVATPTQETRDMVKAALEGKRIDPPAGGSSGSWLRYVIVGILLLLAALLAWKWLADAGATSAAPPPPPMEQPSETNVYADLAKEYFRHLPSENFHLGSEETLEERALAAYEERDYETALPLLLETVEQGGDSLNLLYAGVAALGMGDGEGASILSRIDTTELGRFNDEIFFYLSLGMLGNGKINEAKFFLENISRKSILAESTAKLIQRLNEIDHD